jgi:hypothetical protein
MLHQKEGEMLALLSVVHRKDMCFERARGKGASSSHSQAKDNSEMGWKMYSVAYKLLSQHSVRCGMLLLAENTVYYSLSVGHAK